MLILGIETSCDETAIGIVKITQGNVFILSNVVSSQVKIHKKWGGVVPSLARREHEKNLTYVLEKALGEAKLIIKDSSFKFSRHKIDPNKLQAIKEILEREPELFQKLVCFVEKYSPPNIDLIAVVNGPGLEPALWIGVNFAKALAYVWQKPIVPVNHLEAHLLVNLIGRDLNILKAKAQNNIFPALCLLVSGGHTMLVLMSGLGKYRIIGKTRDDSAGECFDKTARTLGLGYPGGPEIANAAKKALAKYIAQISLPRPMIKSSGYDFSFSGLKTAVLYHYLGQPSKVRKSKNYIRAMAFNIQQAIIDVLLTKTIKAAKEYNVKSVIIGGGVAANNELRSQLAKAIKKELSNVKYLEPEINLCTDNGVMAAVAGYFVWQRFKQNKLAGQSLWDIKAEANLQL